MKCRKQIADSIGDAIEVYECLAFDVKAFVLTFGCVSCGQKNRALDIILGDRLLDLKIAAFQARPCRCALGCCEISLGAKIYHHVSEGERSETLARAKRFILCRSHVVKGFLSMSSCCRGVSVLSQ